MLVLHISDDLLWLWCVSVLGSGWQLWGSDPAAPWSLFVLSFPCPVAEHISLITDRCLFGPVMVLVSFHI